jgi:hypothetical protein
MNRPALGPLDDPANYLGKAGAMVGLVMLHLRKSSFPTRINRDNYCI